MISGKNNYFIHAFIHRFDNKIYDLTYISQDENSDIWEIVFFDLLYSLEINGRKLMEIQSEYLVQPVNINKNTSS